MPGLPSTSWVTATRWYHLARRSARTSRCGASTSDNAHTPETRRRSRRSYRCQDEVDLVRAASPRAIVTGFPAASHEAADNKFQPVGHAATPRSPRAGGRPLPSSPASAQLRLDLPCTANVHGGNGADELPPSAARSWTGGGARRRTRPSERRRRLQHRPAAEAARRCTGGAPPCSGGRGRPSQRVLARAAAVSSSTVTGASSAQRGRPPLPPRARKSQRGAPPSPFVGHRPGSSHGGADAHASPRRAGTSRRREKGRQRPATRRRGKPPRRRWPRLPPDHQPGIAARGRAPT